MPAPNRGALPPSAWQAGLGEATGQAGPGPDGAASFPGIRPGREKQVTKNSLWTDGPCSLGPELTREPIIQTCSNNTGNPIHLPWNRRVLHRTLQGSSNPIRIFSIPLWAHPLSKTQGFPLGSKRPDSETRTLLRQIPISRTPILRGKLSTLGTNRGNNRPSKARPNFL